MGWKQIMIWGGSHLHNWLPKLMIWFYNMALNSTCQSGGFWTWATP